MTLCVLSIQDPSFLNRSTYADALGADWEQREAILYEFLRYVHIFFIARYRYLMDASKEEAVHTGDGSDDEQWK